MKTNTLASEFIQCRLISHSNWSVRIPQPDASTQIESIPLIVNCNFSFRTWLFICAHGWHRQRTHSTHPTQQNQSYTIRIWQIRRPSSLSPAPAPTISPPPSRQNKNKQSNICTKIHFIFHRLASRVPQARKPISASAGWRWSAHPPIDRSSKRL